MGIIWRPQGDLDMQHNNIILLYVFFKYLFSTRNLIHIGMSTEIPIGELNHPHAHHNTMMYRDVSGQGRTIICPCFHQATP